MVDRREHRIGDAERQHAIDLLRSHTGAGRLTLDEFSDLAGQVYAAQTYGQLEDVARSLPPGLVPDVPAPPPPAGASAPDASMTPRPSAGPVARRARSRRRFVAVMSGARTRGRWRAPARIHAVAVWGSVHIDLRDAEIEGPVVDITAWAVMGSVTVTVPPGVTADVDGLVLMGGSSNRTRVHAPLPSAPLVRVHARGLWGGVAARTKRSRAQREAGAPPVGEGRHGDPPAANAQARPVDPLELPRRIRDDVATTLPRLDGRAGVPVPRARSGGDGHRAPPVPPPPPAARAPVAGAPAPHPSGTLTMLVTDIADSTALAERLGDRRWIEVLGDHNSLVREQVEGHGGTEVKAQGDGFLIVFPSARRAILAAVDIQRALARYRDAHPDTPVAVRIGLHTGEIVDVDGDVFGQNVVVAARLADEAAPGEIVVSALTRDLTVSGGDLSFGPAEGVQLKGLSQPWRVHRVEWARDPA